MYLLTLQWRHNERNGLSNDRRLGRLRNRLFRRRSKKTQKLRVTGLCEGNPPVTGVFPSQRASNAEKCLHLMTLTWTLFMIRWNYVSTWYVGSHLRHVLTSGQLIWLTIVGAFPWRLINLWFIAIPWAVIRTSRKRDISISDDATWHIGALSVWQDSVNMLTCLRRCNVFIFANCAREYNFTATSY